MQDIFQKKFRKIVSIGENTKKIKENLRIKKKCLYAGSFPYRNILKIVSMSEHRNKKN